MIVIFVDKNGNNDRNIYSDNNTHSIESIML